VGWAPLPEPFTLSRALTESPTSRPSPKNGEGRAASLRSYCRDPIGGGHRVGNDLRRALFVEGGKA
jgi:hypothetical protein